MAYVHSQASRWLKFFLSKLRKIFTSSVAAFGSLKLASWTAVPALQQPLESQVPKISNKFEIFAPCLSEATKSNSFAQVAQLVEQRTENPRVTGSIPVLGIEQKTAKTFDIKGFALFFVFVRIKKALSKVPEAFAIS